MGASSEQHGSQLSVHNVGTSLSAIHATSSRTHATEVRHGVVNYEVTATPLTARTRSVPSKVPLSEEHLNLLFPHLEPNEAANLNILAYLRGCLLDQIADGLFRLADPGLVNEGDVLVISLDFAGDDLLDQVIGLATLLDLIDEDATLLLHLSGWHLVLVDSNRGSGGDMLGDVLHQLLEVVGTRHYIGLAVPFHHHANLTVVVDVAADHSFARLLPDALFGLGDPLGAEILDRLLHVAVVLLERLLGLHHPRAGALAQSLNVFRCELLFCSHH